MRIAVWGFAVILCLSTVASAATIRVSKGSFVNGPGTTWYNAFNTIQEGVDAASVGDTVLVKSGIYDTGSMATPGYSCLNRVVITNDITVISFTGPGGAVIKGAEATGGGNGADAVRCVYMSAGVLSGFTITNGHTMTSGNYNRDRSGGGVVFWGTSCVVTNCNLSGNSAFAGAGAAFCYLYDCVLSGNSATSDGGGALLCSLTGCTLSDNSADKFGGGAYLSNLNSCLVRGNTAKSFGGGCYNSTVENCLISANSTEKSGGGVYAGTIKNCTIANNSSGDQGGGAANCNLKNCIVYYNQATNSLNDIYRHLGSTQNSCASDGITNGVAGCITAAPQFVDMNSGNYQLSGGSPCINRGDNANAPMPYDLAGAARIFAGIVDMGAYEYGGGSGAIAAVNLLLLDKK